MKRYAVIMITLCAIAAVKVSATAGGFYPDTLLVTGVSYEGVHGYLLTGITQTSIEYQWLSEDGDWFVGDLAAVIMSDGGTVSVYDDQVTDCRYSGWIDDLAEWVK